MNLSHRKLGNVLAVGLCWLATGCAAHHSEPSWDVASIVDRPIDAAKQKLGPPISETLPPIAATPTSAAPSPAPTAQSIWQSDDVTLTATWKPGNQRITTWTIMRPDARAVSEENKTLLLKSGRLAEIDPRYSVEWLESADRALFYSGVRIVPAPRNHDVVLRVTGGPALLEVTYQISSSPSTPEPFMTIAPWEQKATLPDDTQLQLQARVLRSSLGGTSNLKVEILSDGKIVASDASMGARVQCVAEL